MTNSLAADLLPTDEEFLGQIRERYRSGKALDPEHIDWLLAKTERVVDPLRALPRELCCERCRSIYEVWFAPNDLWNAVIRRSDGRDRWNFLCPTCFTVIAAARDVPYTAFELRIEGGVTDEGRVLTEIFAAYEESISAVLLAVGNGRQLLRNIKDEKPQAAFLSALSTTTDEWSPTLLLLASKVARAGQFPPDEREDLEQDVLRQLKAIHDDAKRRTPPAGCRSEGQAL